MPKCISVKLQAFYSISSKCYKTVAYDGSEALIPASQFYGQDYERTKSESYWITEWILQRKDLQYSTKKWSIFSQDGRNIGQIEFKHHKPEKLDPTTIKHDKNLER